MQGNTLDNTIQILGEDFASHSISFSKVYNPTPIRGGIEGRILTTGDYIFIPSEAQDLDNEVNDSGYNQAKYFYGEDLKLEADDFVISTLGDLLTVGFVDNIKQAVEQRLKAEKGDNPSDYNWGTNIPSLLANADIPYEVLPKRLELEIIETLAFEDRVYDIEVQQVDIRPSERLVEVSISMKIVSLDEIVELTGIQIGGNA